MFKKYLITGLAILLPVALTLMVIIFLVDLFTSPFVQLVKNHIVRVDLPPALLLFISRILAMIILCIFILLLGVVARWFIIKNIISGTHSLLSRIPLIKTVYKTSCDIIAALFSLDGKKAFKYPVMFPFPYRPTYSLGFQAGEVAEEIKKAIPTPLVSVFAPTAPHPITGFLFLIPEKDVYKLDMTNEEAVKYLVSCGLLRSGAISKRKKMSYSEDLSQIRVVFFQVADTASKLKRIAETARAHFCKKERFLFLVEDEKALQFVDELLWKFPDTSFLPHRAADEETEERIAITKTKSNVNGAPYAFNLCPTPILLSGFKMIYDFEDLTTPSKKSFSTLRYNAYKQAKMAIESR